MERLLTFIAALLLLIWLTLGFGFETASYWAVFILAGFILSPVISWVFDWIFENWSLSEMLSDMFDTPARRIFAIAVMIITPLLTVSAYSQNVTVVPVKPRAAMILPPVEYDHDYEGDLTIVMVDTLEELHTVCRLDSPYLLACSWHNARSCMIVMVRDEVMRKRGYTTGMLLRHERGHCNGWPGDHPGERAISSSTTHWVPERDRVKIPLPIERSEPVTVKGNRGPR